MVFFLWYIQYIPCAFLFVKFINGCFVFVFCKRLALLFCPYIFCATVNQKVCLFLDSVNELFYLNVVSLIKKKKGFQFKTCFWIYAVGDLFVCRAGFVCFVCIPTHMVTLLLYSQEDCQEIHMLTTSLTRHSSKPTFQWKMSLCRSIFIHSLHLDHNCHRSQ